jgi:hypothetical protein
MSHNVHARPCSGPEPQEENEQESLVRIEDRIEPASRDFYRRAIMTVQKAGIDLLVGGAFAFERYTGISRFTKDFDIFVKARDAARLLEVLSSEGFVTEVTAPHWLAKVCAPEGFVDIIFAEANGAREVDDEWFDYSVEQKVVGLDLRLCPVEEIICSKAFVIDRDRCDAADVAHLIRAHAERLDWNRILRRLGDYWPVLLSHLVLFTFIYPSESHRIPGWLMTDLLRRMQQQAGPASEERLCRGTMLSMTQYRVDILRWGYKDARDLKGIF